MDPIDQARELARVGDRLRTYAHTIERYSDDAHELGLVADDLRDDVAILLPAVSRLQRAAGMHETERRR